MPPYDLGSATLSIPSAFAGRVPVHHAPTERARRALNVTVAAVGLVFAAPLMAVIGLAIRLTSPGPVFYRQTRIGLDRRLGFGGNSRRVVDLGGKPFTIYKFRTMQTEAGG